MLKYVAKRLLQLVPILFGITVLSFVLMHTTSSDVVDVIYDQAGAVSDKVKESKREELGLDRTLPVQYVTWLKNVLGGDMGNSYISGQSVTGQFVARLPATVWLMLVSIFLTLLISLPLGILAAVKQNKAVDYIIRLCSFMGNSMPNFFIALLLVYFFALKLGWFPAIGNSGKWTDVVLPALTLTISMAAKYIRQVRAAVLDELGKGYVTGARARGIHERTILIKNVFRSVLITVVTLLGLSIGSLLGGTAIVESIFMWDGVGKMAVDAITMRDYPVIQAYVVWMAVIYVFINLITDLMYQYLDPRIRMEREG